MAMMVDGGGGAPVRLDPPPPPPPPPPVKPVKLADAHGPAIKAPTPDAAATQSLVHTAANGKPVEAGKALKTLDVQNGGNRFATDRMVCSINDRPLPFVGGAPTLFNTRSIDGTREEKGQTIDTRGTETTTTSHESNTTRTQTDKTETSVGPNGASRTKTTTGETRSKEYDERGHVARDENGREKTTVSRRERKTETRVDGTSASHSESVSGQRGNVTGSASNTTKVDQNGVSNTTAVSGGPAKASAGGGIKVTPDGVTVNSTAGVNVGPVGVEQKAERQAGPNGTKETDTTTVKIASPDGKVVSGKLEYKQSETRELTKNPDGSTTYDVIGETRFTVAGSVDAKNVKVDASMFNGQRTVHTVTVPKGADVKAIDPTKPEAWPEGTRVMIKSEDYKGSTMGVAYARFGVEAGSEVRDGQAIVMEKKAGDTVAVSVGPTAGFTQSGKLKVDIGAGVGVELGGENKVDFAFYKTFDIDLKAPGGKQSFTDVFTGREAPKDNGNGVSNLMDTTYGNWDYKGSAKINTPFGSFGPEHKENSRNVWKTYPDGRIEYSRTYDANGDGKPELTKTAVSRDGKTWDKPVYKLTVEVTTEKNSQLHNAKQFTANPNLKVGDKVEIELTPEQLEDMRSRDMAFAPHGKESPEIAARSQDALAHYIARAGGTEGILTKLFMLKNNPKVGDYKSPLPQIDLNHPLPGKVTVIPK